MGELYARAAALIAVLDERDIGIVILRRVIGDTIEWRAYTETDDSDVRCRSNACASYGGNEWDATPRDALEHLVQSLRYAVERRRDELAAVLNAPLSTGAEEPAADSR
jgi:hypothetical protein